MIQALEASQGDISAAYFCNDDIEYLGEIVDRADVLVVCRAKYNDKLGQAILRARSKGKRVYFDVDDLVFDTEYVHLVVKTLDQDVNHSNVWDTWFAYVGRIGATLRLCDGVITTNEYLAAQVRRYVPKPTYVIPNFLNQEQIAISRRIYDDKVGQKFRRDDKIHLGYFSGTPTHNRDFAVVASALARLLDEDRRTVVRIVGYMELKGPLLDYSSRIDCCGLHDFINLQREIGLVEVNLVPLQDNIFTNCKSELKYFEAAIVGTLSVASPVHSYARCIRNGENGYLATSTEWFEKLVTTIASMDIYPEMARKAQRDAETKYAWFNQTKVIVETLFPEDGGYASSSGQKNSRA